MDTRGVGNEGGGTLPAGRRQCFSRLDALAVGSSDRGWEAFPDPTSLGGWHTRRCLTSVQHNLRLHSKREFSLNGNYRFGYVSRLLEPARETQKLAVFNDPADSEAVSGRFFLT